MSYYIASDDVGIIVRERAAKPKASGWAEISESRLRDHLNEKGFASLERGNTITFTQVDHSYPKLAAYLERHGC